MAFTCGFFNSENGDRKYNAEQMSAIFDGIIADGVFTTIGDHMAVTAGTGMQVLVGTGKAWFDHTWNVNDAAYPLTIAASDVTLSRIDAIVLETNHSDSVRLNKLRVVQGTVASSPAKPTLTNSEKVHQHPLAWVTVAPGVTQIAASAIENAVGTSACPFVTGIIATTDIDDLFAQWNGEFDEWFDNLKAQLSDNVVANLQKQIDARVKIADKATADDVYNGTDDSKWVSPASLNGTVLKIGDIQASGRNLETETNGKFLLCDGRSVQASAYPELKNAIGTTFGLKIIDNSLINTAKQYQSDGSGAALYTYSSINRGSDGNLVIGASGKYIVPIIFNPSTNSLVNNSKTYELPSGFYGPFRYINDSELIGVSTKSYVLSFYSESGTIWSEFHSFNYNVMPQLLTAFSHNGSVYAFVSSINSSTSTNYNFLECVVCDSSKNISRHQIGHYYNIYTYGYIIFEFDDSIYMLSGDQFLKISLDTFTASPVSQSDPLYQIKNILPSSLQRRGAHFIIQSTGSGKTLICYRCSNSSDVVIVIEKSRNTIHIYTYTFTSSLRFFSDSGNDEFNMIGITDSGEVLCSILDFSTNKASIYKIDFPNSRLVLVSTMLDVYRPTYNAQDTTTNIGSYAGGIWIEGLLPGIVYGTSKRVSGDGSHWNPGVKYAIPDTSTIAIPSTTDRIHYIKALK